MSTDTLPPDPHIVRGGLGVPADDAPHVHVVPNRAPDKPRGALALDQERALISQYVSLPSSAHVDAVTLMAALWHMRDQRQNFVGPVAPRLIIASDKTGAGKSTLGHLFELTAGNGKMVAIPSYWGVVRAISERNMGVIIDNYDTIRNGRADLLNLLLVGAYRSTATVMRGKMNEEELPVFGPMALTAVGRKLRVDSDFAPVIERSVWIDVERMPETAELDEWDDDDPAHMGRALGIRATLARWGRDVAPDYVAGLQATSVPGAKGRMRQMWRPLLRVADLAGGDWPERARRALRVLALGESVEPSDDDDPFARLSPAEWTMAQVRHAFTARKNTLSLTTVELLERMASLPGGSRWSVPELDHPERQRILRSRTMSLAGDLATFGVERSSVKVPADDESGRYVNGWWWSDIAEHVPSDLPTFRPSDQDEDEEDVPFD